MYRRTSSFQIVLAKNGESTSRRVGTTTPSAKRSPQCYQRFTRETKLKGVFPSAGKEKLTLISKEN